MKLQLSLIYISIFYLFTTSCKTSSPVLEVLEAPEQFSEAGKAELPQKWWTEFKDPKLNILIENALQNNFSIKSAWQRLAEARAIFKIQSSGLKPDLDAFAGASDSRGGDLGNKDRSEYEIGAIASYEFDLWGRIKSQADAEEFRIKATYEEIQTAALTVTAEISLTWFQLIEAQEQIKVLNMQINTNNKSLQLLTNRFKAGQIRQADVLRQKQLVESDKERIIELEAKIETLQHLLAVLQGVPPQTFKDAAENSTLPSPPDLPSAGVPAQLVNRRPDIRQAHNLILAANKDLAAAITDRYPRLSLSASFSTINGDPAQLFRDWFRSISLLAVAPILDGDERDAEISRNEAIEKRRVQEYGETTLRAFQEVEDALIQENKIKESKVLSCNKIWPNRHMICSKLNTLMVQAIFSICYRQQLQYRI